MSVNTDLKEEMERMRRALQFALLFLIAVAASAQTNTIVANAFPKSLVVWGGLREYGYASGTINDERIIASAYSNGQSGAV